MNCLRRNNAIELTETATYAWYIYIRVVIIPPPPPKQGSYVNFN